MPATAQPASQVRGRWLMILGVAATLVALDQVSKSVVLAHLKPGVPVPFLGEVVQWHLLFNSGAAFSMGSANTAIFTVVSTLVVGFLVVHARKPTTLARGIALAVLCGGAAGNLVDRLVRPPGFGVGHVVDFIAFPHFPVFNVADICITVGAALLVLLSLQSTPSEATHD